VQKFAELFGALMLCFDVRHYRHSSIHSTERNQFGRGKVMTSKPAQLGLFLAFFLGRCARLAGHDGV
jgi:hypothetical protein